MAFFSIIVPVYQVEAYIHACIHSVLEQSFSDFELILVDDGSPDGCPHICDEYAGTDQRVCAIHKENGGLSSARNAGLDAASGQYTIFLDGDDFWNDKNALRQLYEKLLQKDSDVILFGCTDWNMTTDAKAVTQSDYNLSIFEEDDIERILHYLLSEKKLPGGACVFAVRRSVAERRKIRFAEGVTAEDYDWILEVFFSCKSAAAVNNPFYTYRKGRGDSITATADLRIIKGITDTIDKWTQKAASMEHEILKKDLLNYLAFMYSTAVVMVGRMNRENREKAISVLKKYRNILRHAYWLKPKLVNASVTILGYRPTSWMLNKYIQYFHV